MALEGRFYRTIDRLVWRIVKETVDFICRIVFIDFSDVLTVLLTCLFFKNAPQNSCILILIKGSRVIKQIFKLQLIVSETIFQFLRTIVSVTRHGRERNNRINRTCILGWFLLEIKKTLLLFCKWPLLVIKKAEMILLACFQLEWSV